MITLSLARDTRWKWCLCLALLAGAGCGEPAVPPLPDASVDMGPMLPPVYFDVDLSTPDAADTTIQEAATVVVVQSARAFDTDWICAARFFGIAFQVVPPECETASGYSRAAVESMLRTGVNASLLLDCVEANDCDSSRFRIGCGSIMTWMSNLPNRLYDLEGVQDINAYSLCRPWID